jgi:predicted Zn-dependent protease with MMP-like domain
MEASKFDELVGRAFDSIPERFRERLHGAAVCVEEICDEDPELLGVFEGISDIEKSLNDVAPLPDRIILYQTPIEEEAAETEGDVYRVVRETLIHEIAHRFGYDEDEIEEKFENRWK